MSDHRCPRCGAPLKTEVVQVPVYVDTPTAENPEARVLARYDEREEVGDCVRCTGAY